MLDFVAVAVMSSNKPIPRKQAVSNAKPGRRHGISTSQLWDWRARHKAGLLEHRAEFSQVVVTQETPEGVQDQARSADACPDLVVEVGQCYRLTIPAGFDMDAAVRLLRGLA